MVRARVRVSPARKAYGEPPAGFIVIEYAGLGLGLRIGLGLGLELGLGLCSGLDRVRVRHERGSSWLYLHCGGDTSPRSA
jgi:hypothetical protein